jgi:hypothetical protein
VLGAGRARIQHLDLEVLASNTVACSLYARWGFRDEGDDVVVADLKAPRAQDVAVRSIHIQSDNLSAVEDAVRLFVPRLPGGSRGSLVSPPRNGWIAVYDDVCDRNPEMLRRLARELSDRMGSVTLLLGVERDELVRMILFERGRIVDEYCGPEFCQSLPPGDVGTGANPTVAASHRGRTDAVRRIAVRPRLRRTFLRRELLADLTAALGIEVQVGWADAPDHARPPRRRQ